MSGDLFGPMDTILDHHTEAYTQGLVDGLRLLREQSPAQYAAGLEMAEEFIQKAKDRWLRTGSNG